MRTKTLLTAAAALAVGVLSSKAQVYSQNIVGYYNVTVPANKAVLISLQLNDGTGHYPINSLLTNGIPDSSTLLMWNGAGFDSFTYFAGFGWYSGANYATNELKAGYSAYLYSGDASSDDTFTVVGSVPTNTVVNIPAGVGFYSLGVPISTNLDSSVASFPSQDTDVYYVWDVASQSYTHTYTYFAGFGWFEGANQVYPSPKVGEGFLYANNGVQTNWDLNFTVDQ